MERYTMFKNWKAQHSKDKHCSSLFVHIDKLTRRFTWKDKGTRTAKIILKRNMKVGGNHTI